MLFKLEKETKELGCIVKEIVFLTNEFREKWLQKISFGSSLFGALAYNQEKVDEGEGKVLGTNKVLTNADGTVDMHACMRDFESRMPAHIQDTQAHCSYLAQPSSRR